MARDHPPRCSSVEIPDHSAGWGQVKDVGLIPFKWFWKGNGASVRGPQPRMKNKKIWHDGLLEEMFSGVKPQQGWHELSLTREDRYLGQKGHAGGFFECEIPLSGIFQGESLEPELGFIQ